MLVKLIIRALSVKPQIAPSTLGVCANITLPGKSNGLQKWNSLISYKAALKGYLSTSVREVFYNWAGFELFEFT